MPKNFLKNLRLADLELFITAAHLKNLGKAATMHSLSQSAAIKRVESSFNLHLCTHEKRQFRVTKEGENLLPALTEWISQIQKILTLL